MCRKLEKGGVSDQQDRWQNLGTNPGWANTTTTAAVGATSSPCRREGVRAFRDVPFLFQLEICRKCEIKKILEIFRKHTITGLGCSPAGVKPCWKQMRESKNPQPTRRQLIFGIRHLIDTFPYQSYMLVFFLLQFPFIIKASPTTNSEKNQQKKKILLPC